MRDPSAPIPAPLETPLNWNKHSDGEAANVRRLSALRIQPIVNAHQGPETTALYLSIGEACPFTRQWERNIWLQECARILDERSEARHG